MQAVKERPIILSRLRVKSLLAGRMTQVRKICEPAMTAALTTVVRPGADGFTDDKGAIRFHCPYGAPGDHLYVLESTYAYGRWEKRRDETTGRNQLQFVDMTRESGRAYQYLVDIQEVPRANWPEMGWHHRHPVEMPRAAARLILEIVDVRVERLQCIGVEEIQAEGVVTSDVSILRDGCRARVIDFSRMWDRTNGAGSWDADPWVWVIEFKRLALDQS